MRSFAKFNVFAKSEWNQDSAVSACDLLILNSRTACGVDQYKSRIARHGIGESSSDTSSLGSDVGEGFKDKDHEVIGGAVPGYVAEKDGEKEDDTSDSITEGDEEEIGDIHDPISEDDVSDYDEDDDLEEAGTCDDDTEDEKFVTEVELSKLSEDVNLTPKEIIKYLDRHIIGQSEAKKAVAIALRNRWRRAHVPQPLRDEIVPKNIMMKGSTGVGKTEIARRLAKLAKAPFIKVEATKFTEIGYVGRDVDSIIRDLLDIAINLVRENYHSLVKDKAVEAANKTILDALVGSTAGSELRELYARDLREKKLEDDYVSIKVKEKSKNFMSLFDFPGNSNNSQIGIMNLNEIFGKVLGGNKESKVVKMSVREARETLMAEEQEKMIDEDMIVKEALRATENDGVVFLDEIDKIATRNEMRGSEVNREGVQRDLLPLLEGTTVSTKYGPVKTEHILFIASGSFHLAKPSDLLPELQGRLPIRVELKPLEQADLVKILKEPEASLIRQYVALMKTENIDLEFTEDGIEKAANIAHTVNRDVEDIGARRLHTVMEKLVEDVSFTSDADAEVRHYTIDASYVDEKLSSITKQTDLSKFVL